MDRDMTDRLRVDPDELQDRMDAYYDAMEELDAMAAGQTIEEHMYEQLSRRIRN
jgi:hypothetical protein